MLVVDLALSLLCESEFPLALVFVGVCGWHVHADEQLRFQVLRARPLGRKFSSERFALTLACALRSPLAAFVPRRLDAVGSREVFESYACHSLWRWCRRVFACG